MTLPTPFRKILIANRGEIALRIMRTAHAMGFRTVAVFSTADRGARHVREAHQAVHIGESRPAESYLNIGRVIEAAKRSGAHAVHPGYGFLAESGDFATACRDAGLVFVGPPPEAIVAMGNKAQAKRLMQSAGVPCVPGYDGKSQEETTLAAEADRVGYPIVIKATAGGGGRGMRLVQAREQFFPALRSARSEAQAAFGSAEVILERAIEEPRHIEVQVFADRHGNVIHLGERDCSIQRRYQKLIEEAPSPAVTPEIRTRMGATAVAAARAIRYEGAGTLEFLLDREGRFYFMEMNTRLQVEHPVTEAITGLDLVELQLRVAAGDRLPLAQEDVRLRGHAIECRLCAESVGLGFIPQAGVMTRWEMPSSVRVDHALESGARVSPFYDSMLAKLVGYGTTREDARRRLVSALEDTVALGVETNQAFLGACLEHPEFAAGRATTSFIGKHREGLMGADPDRDERAHRIAAVLLSSSPVLVPQESAHDGSVISHPLPILFRFETDSSPCVATVVRHGVERYEVTIAGRAAELTIERREGDEVTFSLDGLMERAVFRRDARELHLKLRGRVYHVVDTTHAAATRKAEVGCDGKVRAAMAGRVVSVFVSPGALVSERQAVLTLEAMKMEHTLMSPVAGTVASVHVVLGAQVSAKQVLVEITASPVAPETQDRVADAGRRTKTSAGAEPSLAKERA